jgi:hypothetical protein
MRIEVILGSGLTATQVEELTRRIRLGTLPTSPYEVHPLRIADQLLTLNELSQGRATILIGGLGHSVTRVTGLQPTRRVTAVRETVSILKGLRPGAQLDFRGELYSLMNYRAGMGDAAGAADLRGSDLREDGAHGGPGRRRHDALRCAARSHARGHGLA